ncbi:MAG: hypothetical protein ACXAEU_24200 [Candidatus Hodarchaeales archaeon]
MGDWIQRYGKKLDIEVYEGNKCPYHKKGDRFSIPSDLGKICPWLLDSAHGMMRAMMMEGFLPWNYKGTPYEKDYDEEEGHTTEFVRCPDPTSAGIVIKITSQLLE